ncbi:cytochrome b5-like heme/steroid binding domain-containing protein Ecym_4346 [Eremothecium cymbalariae DBVPG|uniref:Cytochrome b5 heme-binding domain-containing protein n=1 Tax=Eremothecium cymbalariae (strain CBS 270.75 / DBVPG 7215 / KCTC 17166 / NRRL Y-17582) TaxID=931890 RepID=G8JTQ4_ERECY|nr:hypothetical protein Ecym_4346 [Eremothecium cymbalariae DBVPG\
MLPRKISLSEVRRHTSADDCWFIIHNKVYDITNLLSTHPGGAKTLLKYAGRDATLPFDDVGHSTESLVYDMAPGSCLGEVDLKPHEGGLSREDRCLFSQSKRLDGGVDGRRRNSWFSGWGGEGEDVDGDVSVTVQSMGTRSEKLDSDFNDWLKNVLLLFVISVCCVLLLVIRYQNHVRQVQRLGSDWPFSSFTTLDFTDLPVWIDSIPV